MWQLDRKKGQPIYQGIVELVLTHIKDGRLLPGEKLPPERQLAKFFDVNRSTVVHALDELEAMGVVHRRQGSGTVINEGKWGIYTSGATNWRRYISQGPFNRTQPYLEKLKRLARQAEPTTLDAFSGDLPLELIPSLELPQISWNDFLIEETLQDQFGYLPLRLQLVAELNTEHHLTVAPDQLLLTSGAQQALYLIVQVLLKSGDAVAIEEPSSFFQLPIFQAAGIRLHGVPVDSDGMQVELLEQKIIRHQIKMVIVNPNFQNPTGTTMSLNRRKHLISLCQQYEIPIVEDDIFSQLYFDADQKPTLLKELDSENVIYIGSLSKILGTTTKIGWLSAPVRVTEKLAEALQEMDFSLSIFPQVLAASALSNDNYEKEIAQLRQKLLTRRNQLIEAIDHYIGSDKLSYTIPKGGYYLWLTFHNCEIKQSQFDRLLAQNILIMPGFLFGSDKQSLRINFARLRSEEIIVLVKAIKQCFLTE